ncbi:MAG: glucoamylase family protein, partial [Smithellaceae bacterium]
MNLIYKTASDLLLKMKNILSKKGFRKKHIRAESPLRSELLSAEQMKQHGKILAAAHQLTDKKAAERLLGRLHENEIVLIETIRQLTSVVTQNRPIAPAEEWLLDNFYLIEDNVRTAKRHLSRGYSRGLPWIVNGPSVGLPRVYDIAREIISHGDGRVDLENLVSFLTSYQSVSYLKLGELWAIPIMLRLALIENLRRVGTRIMVDIADRVNANDWADQMVDIAKRDPKNLVLLIADMARSDPALSASFVAEFSRRLQGKSPALALPLSWIEQRLSESHLNIEKLITSGNQQLAADQASVSNSIGSLRFLTTMDWREFVETLSVVEKVLREDPADVYIRMDFVTRDHYRHVVEKIAKNSSIFERDVARIAIDMAREARAQKGGDDRSHHVGFYLIDKGLTQLEKNAQIRLPFYDLSKRWICRFPLLLYLGGILGITLSLAGYLLSRLHADGLSIGVLLPMTLVLVICTSSLGVALTNWLATLLAQPRLLARMDFSREIPPEESTLVVIPSMLSDAQSVESLIESLEIRFLTNRDNNLHFGLLTDFCDAASENMPEDDMLLRLAEKGIKDLHDKYRGVKGGKFFLFHRPRRWNPHDQLWMGYERKRGKLAELNAFLRGGAKDCFSKVVGAREILSNVKYIITLDTDTQLPRDAAQKFIGTLAHPLNRPRLDESRNIITAGYGILQPRLTESLSGEAQTRYSWLWGGETGIDPYTRMVSDIYQDVFGEGSFVGKGIYDIDAFEKVLHERLPENRILSHDLIEGCHARAGLISDVELYESYPARYATDVSRRHRWIRGDWQIAGWLRSTVPWFGQGRRNNEISTLSQWKILDNLRRSLVPASLSILLIAGWTILSPGWFWTLLVVGILLMPSAFALTLEMFRKPGDVLFKDHAHNILHQGQRHLLQNLFTLACLPYEAFYALDAVLRTSVRMLITHKRLLEWNPFSNHVHLAQNDFSESYRTMWMAPLVSVSVTAYLSLFRPEALWVALPVLILWFASPAITWWTGRPLLKMGISLMDEQISFLRKSARRTWSFFETFVGSGDHWLPPDNFQEHPGGVIAHRTSPTNMGLALLANLSAYDFGFILQGEFIRRTANTLGTMDKLDRYRGHFYNWYDTQTLKTLPPHYISTVDSGNLCGHLITLKWGLLDLPDQKLLSQRFLEGIIDTCNVLMDIADNPLKSDVAKFKNNLPASASFEAMTAVDLWASLQETTRSAMSLSSAVEESPANHCWLWTQTLIRQCREAQDELIALCPWAALETPSGRAHRMLEGIGIPTLRDAADLSVHCQNTLDTMLSVPSTAAEQAWANAFHQSVLEGSRQAKERLSVLHFLIKRAGDLAVMDFSFLYDKGRQLLSIGFSVGERRRDSSFYDLLASEARLCCFVAIAQGQLPQESWFALGRMLTNPGGEPVLLAWDGSMFEYLMPLLVMPNYENTLLDQTYKASVRRQIEYGRKRGVPWGVSESGYSTADVHLNYQYRAFGVPGLGLKRGLADDLVIAPYATALALMVTPRDACLNLQRLEAEGMMGAYGFYEAMDFTPVRVPAGQSRVIVRSFMAHHQGMTLLSIAYLLLNRPMQRRFESEPMFQSAALLLQERIPKAVSYYKQITEDINIRKEGNQQKIPPRSFKTPDTPAPEVQLLSNGRYHVMVTQAGGGYSRWNDLAVTRWREDTTRDGWGMFCYIRDISTGAFWSNTYLPTLKKPDRYEAIFSDAKVEFRRRDDEINTYTQIAVSPEDDIEIRRIRITNRSRKRRDLDVTSYAEIVIAPQAADEIHPAFSNLFVQTEILRERHAILCTRRPRSKEEPTFWSFHLMSRHGGATGKVSYETDRLKFAGRVNALSRPQAMEPVSQALSNSEGSVLDPIVSIRHRISLAPGESATLDIVHGMGDTREKAMALVERYADRRLADRVFNLAWTHSQVVLRQINATESDAQLYAQMAGHIIFAGAMLRVDPKVIIKNRRGQSGLWGYAISGDIPIVLLQIADHANIDLVRQMQQAHAYWRLKGLAVDLVIWNEDDATYRQTLHDQIVGLIATSMETRVMDRPGGIFVRPGDQISSEDRILLQTVSRVIIKDSLGTLEKQLIRREKAFPPMPRLKPARSRYTKYEDETPSIPVLQLANGLGGFTPDGREYVIVTDSRNKTPLPWANVIASPHFGTIISESGSAATWSENAHEYRLTPWQNDPVS